MAAAGSAVTVHGHNLSTAVEIKRIEIELARLPVELDGFELVQLSDIHFESGPFKGPSSSNSSICKGGISRISMVVDSELVYIG